MLDGMSLLNKAGFQAGCIAVWSLTLPLCVAAQDTTARDTEAQAIPKDEAGFTKYVTGQIHAELGDASIAIRGPLKVAVGNMQGNLDRIFGFCQRNSDGCSKEIAIYVKALAQAYRDENVPPSREALRIVVRTSEYVQEVQEALGPGTPPLHPVALAEGLVLLPVLDAPRTIRMLTDDDSKALGLTAAEAQQLAMTNLRNSLKPLMDAAKIAGHGKIGQIVGDPFDSSRLALHDTWAPLAAAQGGKLIVAVPATDAVFYVGEDSTTAIDALRTLAKNVMARAPNRLSDILLRWTSGGWEVVR
jgi:uncharacterized protein YtpQ (UPF0354 family)